jgi:TPR repeat protein
MRRSPALLRAAVPAAFLALAAPAAAETAAERCALGAAKGDRAACEAAVAAAPADPRLRRLLAVSRTKAGDYDGAIEAYREVTRLTPLDGQAHYELGWMLAFVRRYAESAAPFEEAMRLRPDHAPTYRAAAIVYELLKRHGDMFRVMLAGARLGDEIAMFDTYHCYERGRGTERNDSEALAWLTRAGEAGHVTAMDKLAEIYLNGGLGAKTDEGLAERWATRARLARNGGKL